MSDSRPPYDRRPTRPIPREDLAPISRSDLDEEPEPETMVPCPWCERYSPHGGVPIRVRKEWLEAYAELHTDESKQTIP